MGRLGSRYFYLSISPTFRATDGSHVIFQGIPCRKKKMFFCKTNSGLWITARNNNCNWGACWRKCGGKTQEFEHTRRNTKAKTWRKRDISSTSFVPFPAEKAASSYCRSLIYTHISCLFLYFNIIANQTMNSYFFNYDFYIKIRLRVQSVSKERVKQTYKN